MASVGNASIRDARWRASRWLALVELSLAVGLIVADRHHMVPLSNTPFLLVLGWISLRLRGLRWRDVGLVKPPRWLGALALGTLAGISMELLAIFVTEPWIARLVGRYPDISDFRPLVGNFKLLLLLVAANWVLAAFGEELAHRGYLMNRVAGLGGGTRTDWLVSLVLVSAFFGWAHGESQGLAGALQEGLAGLLLASLYLASGRNLAVSIVAHGVSNTLALVLIFFDRYPGV